MQTTVKMSDPEHVVMNGVLLSSVADGNHIISSNRGLPDFQNDVDMRIIGHAKCPVSLFSGSMKSSELHFKPYLSQSSTTDVQQSDGHSPSCRLEESLDISSPSSTVLIRPENLQEKEISDIGDVICCSSIECNIVNTRLGDHIMAPFRFGLNVPIEDVVSNCDWLLKSVEDGLRYERAVANYLSEELKLAKSVNDTFILKSYIAKNAKREDAEIMVDLVTKLSDIEEPKVSQIEIVSVKQNNIPSFDQHSAREHRIDNVEIMSPIEAMIIDKLEFIQSFLMNAVPLAEDSKISDTSSTRYHFNHGGNYGIVPQLEKYFKRKDSSFLKRSKRLCSSRKMETEVKNNQNCKRQTNGTAFIHHNSENLARQLKSGKENAIPTKEIANYIDVKREDMYRSQIQQLQQENRHIQEILLSRHEDPVDERGAVPDEDKVHLQQELSALKSLLKEQSARIAEASEASNKRVEAVSLEKREAMAATESMAQQHARDVRAMQEEIDHAARLLAEHELEAESSREAAVHQSREQARALAEAVAKFTSSRDVGIIPESLLSSSYYSSAASTKSPSNVHVLSSPQEM